MGKVSYIWLALAIWLLPGRLCAENAPPPVSAAPAQKRSVGMKKKRVVKRARRPASLPEANAPETPRLTLQLAQEYYQLNNGYGLWRGTGLQATYVRNTHTALRGEFDYLQRFGDRGAYFSGGVTQSFNETWYGSLDLATSHDGYFLPSFRGDAAIFHKWPTTPLVSSLGVTYVVSKDGHRMVSPFIGFIYYLNKWVVETGFRLNISQPGSVFGYSIFGAATYTVAHACQIVGRIEVSQEAYQAITVDQTLVDFPSWKASLVWKQWVVHSAGFVAGVEVYRNPYYSRYGGELGLFVEF